MTVFLKNNIREWGVQIEEEIFFLGDVWKFIIYNIKINVFQQHKLITDTHTIHKNGDIDPFLGDKVPIIYIKNTIDRYN